MEPILEPLPDGNGEPGREPPRHGTGPPVAAAGGSAPPARGFWPRAGRLARSLMKHIVRYNPAYILSAALMIAGLYSILKPSSQDVGNLLAILATFSSLQLYELLLVGIALYLIRRLRVMDDGATLVIAEALFVVGSFIILDEVTFNGERVMLGLSLGLLAALLATCRFAALALGRALGRTARLALLVSLAALFAWNGVAPAAVARAHALADPRTAALFLSGWWVLPALALPLALFARARKDELWPRGRAFVESPVAAWMLAGIVVLVSGVHQNRIGYILDLRFVLSDTLPLATVLGVGAVNLLASARVRRPVLEHVVAAVPAGLCLAALATRSFGAVGWPGWPDDWAAFPSADAVRMLTWPVAWLGVSAGLTLVHAWRRRSGALAHQAAVEALVAAAFVATTSPEAVRLSPTALAVALAAYLLLNAVVYRSPACAIAVLVLANAGVRRYWPSAPVEGVRVPPAYVLLATAGVSCFVLWLVFRRWAPRWLPHVGTALVLLAVSCANFSPSTRAPLWALALVSAALCVVLAVVGRLFGWWVYYALAGAAACVLPAQLLGRLEQKGWLLIFAAFVALGLGLLLSTRKAPHPAQPQGP